MLFDIELETSDRRLLRMSGAASIKTDRDLPERYKLRDARKCFRSWRGLMMSLRNLHRLYLTAKYLSTANSDNRHCVIEVDPVSIELIDSA